MPHTHLSHCRGLLHLLLRLPQRVRRCRSGVGVSAGRPPHAVAADSSSPDGFHLGAASSGASSVSQVGVSPAGNHGDKSRGQQRTVEGRRIGRCGGGRSHEVLCEGIRCVCVCVFRESTGLCHTVAPDAFFFHSAENQILIIVLLLLFFFTRAHVWSPTRSLSGISVRLEVNEKMPNMKRFVLGRRRLIGCGNQAVNNNNKQQPFCARDVFPCGGGTRCVPAVRSAFHLEQYIYMDIY